MDQSVFKIFYFEFPNKGKSLSKRYSPFWGKLIVLKLLETNY